VGTMAKTARLGSLFSVQWFCQIFNDETCSTHASEQFLPTVNVLESTRLTYQRSRLGWRQWITAIIGRSQPINSSLSIKKAAFTLFVLADIRSIYVHAAGHLPINLLDIGNVTGSVAEEYNVKIGMCH